MNHYSHMFHSEIPSPWSFLTFWNGFHGIRRKLCVKMWFWQFSTHKKYVTVRGKLAEQHFDDFFPTILVRRFENQGKLFAFQTFSSGLEKNKASKCGSESFPRTVTYILCVENCQNQILTHSCLPISGRPFQNVKKTSWTQDLRVKHMYKAVLDYENCLDLILCHDNLGNQQHRCNV